MTRVRFLGAHRNWEDWLSIMLGIITGVSPWIPGEMGSQAMMLNAVFVGFMLFLLGELEAVNLHRWQEGCLIALGMWLGVSPIIFGYVETGLLRFWHFALASVIVVLGVVELWQDWNLTNEELAEHEN